MRSIEQRSALGRGTVLVLGLSPAWQQTIELDQLQPDAVNRARAVHWSASGKVLNVGRSLATLAVPQRVICPMGGLLRPVIEADVAVDRVHVDWITTAAPMRTCTTLVDHASGAITELVENAGPMTAAELATYGAAVERAIGNLTPEVVVVTGSFPAGVPVDFFASLLRDVASTIAARLVLDLRGAALRAMLPLRPCVAKPNRAELAETVGRPINTQAELLAAMAELNALGAEWVVVTQGAEAVWARSEAALYRVSPPRAEVVNSIGCGDALTAGMAAALAAGLEMDDALRWGVAAATDRLTHLLPGKSDRGRVEKWLTGVKVERGEG